MKITIKVQSKQIKNNYYVIVIEENRMILINEDDYGIGLNDGELYDTLHTFFKKNTSL